MDRSILDKIRQNLEERRARLGQGLRRLDLEQSELDRVDSQAEMVDIAQSLEQIGRNSSIQEQELKELQAIDRAMAKLATVNYGVCEDCDEAIPEKRLLAVPEARLCARCQSIWERESQRVRPAS
ncbi:TraR/DksA family transcriptional regulator [bacterium]|nr:TraR/DksA family transcriptional regulator [bacterium]